MNKTTPNSIRLDKFLANAGILSRRGIKQFLKHEMVTINGKRVTESGVRLDPQKDTVLINGQKVKLVSPDQLPPRYYLSEKDDILLCGKIDWLEYIPFDNSVHIIDFKTGNNEEKEDSLQLPIYALLVKNCQNRFVSKISYWYLEKDNEPRQMKFPDLDEAHAMILAIALRIKEARASNIFACLKNGCFACKPLEQIIEGKAQFVGTSDYQDIYIIPQTAEKQDYVKEDIEPF